jgi:hypothetical protein
MGFKAVKCAVIALGMLGAAGVAWGDDDHGRSFISYSHAGDGRLKSAFDDDNGGMKGGHRWTHVSSAPEPSEWLLMGVGLVLIAGLAHRRHSRLLEK